MNNQTKIKEFWRNYKKIIIPVGGIIIAGGIARIVNKAYWAGARNGVDTTCYTMMDYLDEILPESEAREAWEQFRKTCPEINVVYTIFE